MRKTIDNPRRLRIQGEKEILPEHGYARVNTGLVLGGFGVRVGETSSESITVGN